MAKRSILALSVAISLIATSASAMTVQQFLTTAAGIPRNPTAMFRADTRRLLGEIKTAFEAIRKEQTAAQSAGTRAATCMPKKVPIDANQLLARFNAIPAARRTISVTQAMREWMADRYPCPA